MSNINTQNLENIKDEITDDINEISTTFDARTSLTSLYLWLLFGYLSSMVSCDVQKLMTNNILFRHIVGVIAFFLLFTLIDKDNKLHIYDIWKKTLVIYFVFLLMIKSKWYFSLPVLFILIVDQSIKSHIEYLTRFNTKDNNIKNIIKFKKLRDVLYKILIGIIILGFLNYNWRQYNQFEKDFSFTKLLFTATCKN